MASALIGTMQGRQVSRRLGALDGPTSELFAPVGRPRAGMQRALHETRHDLPMRKHTVSLRVGEYGAQRRASAAGRPSRLSRPRQKLGETRCVTKEWLGPK